MNINEFRKKYPEYDNRGDYQLANSLYSKFYTDKMSRKDFNNQFFDTDQDEHSFQLEDSLTTLSNVLKVIPAVDAAANLAYNMVVTFPATMAAFAKGAVEDIREAHFEDEGWDLDKARKAYSGMSDFLHIKHMTKGGEQLSNAAFSTLEEAAMKAGEYVTDKTDSPLMGALTYSTAQMLPFVVAGSTLRQFKVKNLKDPKRPSLNITPKEAAFDFKADLVGAYKDAHRAGDAKSMAALKKIIKNTGNLSASEIPVGTVIELPVKPQQFYPLVVIKKGQRKVKPFKAGDPQQAVKFKATDNIAEIRKDIKRRSIEIKNEIEGRLDREAVSVSKKKRHTTKAQDDAQKKSDLRKVQKKIEDAKFDELYERNNVDVDMFELNSKGGIADITAEQLTLKFSIGKDIQAKAKTKSLDYKNRISSDGGVEIIIKDKLGNKHVFRDLESPNEFIKGYTGNFAEIENLYYQVLNKAKERSPHFVEKQFRKESVHREPYIVETTRKFTKPLKPLKKKQKISDKIRKEIDDAMPPKEGETIPQPDLGVMEPVNFKTVFPNVKEPGVGWAMQYFEPAKHYMMDITARTKVNFFEGWRKTQDGLHIAKNSARVYEKQLHKLEKGMNFESAKRIKRFMSNEEGLSEVGTYKDMMKFINGDKSLAQKFGRLTEKEFNAAKGIRKILIDSGTEYGIKLEDMINRYVPRMLRKGVQDFSEAIKTGIMPEEYKWAATMQREGYLFPQEENIFRIARSYVGRGSKKKYLGDEIEKLVKMRKDAKNQGRLTKAELNMVDEYIDKVRSWSTGFDDLVENTALIVTRALNKMPPFRWKTRFQNVKYRHYEKKVPTPEGGFKKVRVHEPTGESFPGYFETYNIMSKLITLETNLMSAGALGMRPVLVIRNMAQSMLGMPIVGPRAWLHGAKRALTPEGMTTAKARMWLMDNYLPLGGDIPLTSTLSGRAAQKGLWGFTKVDGKNRAINGFAMEWLVKHKSKKFEQKISKARTLEERSKVMERFINDTGCDFLHRAIIENEFIPLAKAKMFSSLAERMGRHLSEETQFIYRKANAPYWMKGQMGRVAGRFGTWSHWYLQYGRALAFRGSKINRAKRIAIFTGQSLMMQEVGKRVFGVDISKWFFLHPLGWMGGPLLHLLKAGKNIATGGHNVQESIRELESFGKVHIPYKLAVDSIMDARYEIKTEDKVKKGLGFKPTYED